VLDVVSRLAIFWNFEQRLAGVEGLFRKSPADDAVNRARLEKTETRRAHNAHLRRARSISERDPKAR